MAEVSHVAMPEPEPDKSEPDKPEKLTSLARVASKSVSPPVLSPVYDERRMSTASEGKSECSGIISPDDEASRYLVDSTVELRMPQGYGVRRSPSRMSSVCDPSSQSLGRGEFGVIGLQMSYSNLSNRVPRSM